jgi:hypothetical protein
MGIVDVPASEARPRPARARALPRAAFTAAIFLSAALLFMVQPMFAKLVLPRFGGAPQVWSVAIVFFQAALLAGYAYAHWLTRCVSGRTAVGIHLALMLAAALALPPAIAPGWGRPPATGETLWLIGLFAASIGLPFFALAANSPLLQAWFARTDRPAADEAYSLYAAGNVGSFLALVAYPLAVEPFVRLGAQATLWSIGFCLLIALLAGCGALRWRARAKALAATFDAGANARPGWREAASWVALSAVPSGLLVAVTAHISTDVAAVPLIWVLPLALYLLTFAIVFARRRLIPHRLVLAAQPVFVVALVAAMIYDALASIVALIALHLAVFFVNALMCHGELARMRPPPGHLTAFYLWMAVGGVIGGIATGLIAPHVLDWVAEYPILLALAVLCRPPRASSGGPRRRYLLLIGIAIAIVILGARALSPAAAGASAFNWVAGALLASSLLLWRRPLPFAAIIAFVLLAGHGIGEAPGTVSVRSFFGVAKVWETSDGRFRLLQHGTTLHGGQRIRGADGTPAETDPPELLLYYWDGSAIAQAFEAARARGGGAIRYAVIGLGTGSLACRAEPGDSVHYYEIDPAIVRIARDPRLFSFLQDCRPDAPITLGDARLTLAEAPDGAYDLIVVDAFTSDAIPIHLLTREAMALYLRKLAAHGMVVLHVSNRYLELASVVAGIAAANGLAARLSDTDDPDEAANPYKFGGTVVAVARSEDDFGALAQAPDWQPLAADPAQWTWSDDYSNVLGAMIRRLKGL